MRITLATPCCPIDRMGDENYAVLVALNHYNSMEREKTKAIIPLDNGRKPPVPGEEVVVSVGCWKLEPGFKRIGEFQNDTGRPADDVSSFIH